MLNQTKSCLTMSKRILKKWRMTRTIPCVRQFSTRSRRAQTIFLTVLSLRRKLLAGNRSWAVKLCCWKWCQKWPRVATQGLLLSHRQATYNLPLTVLTIRGKWGRWMLKEMSIGLQFIHGSSLRNNGHLLTFCREHLEPRRIHRRRSFHRRSSSTWLLIRSSSQEHMHRQILLTPGSTSQLPQDLTKSHSYKCSRAKVSPKLASTQHSVTITHPLLPSRTFTVPLNSTTPYLRSLRPQKSPSKEVLPMQSSRTTSSNCHSHQPTGIRDRPASTPN